MKMLALALLLASSAALAQSERAMDRAADQAPSVQKLAKWCAQLRTEKRPDAVRLLKVNIAYWRGQYGGDLSDEVYNCTLTLDRY